VDLLFCCAKAEVALAATSAAINKENRSIQNSPLFKARTLNAGFDPFNLFARKPPLARCSYCRTGIYDNDTSLSFRS
jgi:hypothetical protein